MRSFTLRSVSFGLVFGLAAFLVAITGFTASAQTSTIGPAASTLTISSNATSGTQDSTTITLSASVVPTSGSVTPTGYVIFFSNGVPLFVSAPLVDGKSSQDVLTLPVGTDVITATYVGDKNFQAEDSSNSVTITITGLPPALLFQTFAPATATVIQGNNFVFSGTITANPTFGGTIAFACSGAPAEASCTVTPNSTTIVAKTGYQATAQTATISVLFASTQPNGSVIAQNLSPTILKSAGGVGIAGLLLLILPRRRGKGWNVLTMLAIIGLGLCSMTALTGCGNGKKATTVPGTAPGTYPLTITATSGSITQTATVMVTVTK